MTQGHETGNPLRWKVGAVASKVDRRSMGSRTETRPERGADSRTKRSRVSQRVRRHNVKSAIQIWGRCC